MTYAALLRAVNVGGRLVAMAELRVVASSLGLKDVRTLLQSGNLVFESSNSAATVGRELATSIKRRFDLDVPVVVRSETDLKAVVRANPFAAEADDDPGRLVVVFLESRPKASAETALQNAIVGRERVALRDESLYAYYPDGQGRSKLTPAVIERHLGVKGTARNWNTVTKLTAMMAGER
jgi:uncharacterized protein (DUF1697 family)